MLRFLLRNCPALLCFASGFVWEVRGYGIAAIFVKHVAIRRAHCIFTDCGALQDGGRTAARPSKCGAHGGRKVVHMTPCFKCRCGTFVAFSVTSTVPSFVFVFHSFNIFLLQTSRHHLLLHRSPVTPSPHHHGHRLLPHHLLVTTTAGRGGRAREGEGGGGGGGGEEWI